MTRQNTNDGGRPLLRLADEFVDDILAASDEEIIGEFKEAYGDPVSFANCMREKIDLFIIGANKDALLNARQALNSENCKSIFSEEIDVTLARSALSKLLEKRLGVMPLTIAARNEKVSELSDNDVLSLVQDLEALGFVLRKKNSD